MRNFGYALVTAGLLAVVSGAANAATYTSLGTCKTTDLTAAASACFGTIAETPINDNNVDFETSTFGGVTGLFGKTDWTQVAKWDTDSQSASGSIGLTLTNGNGKSGSGNWSVNSGALSIYSYIAIIVKQANTFAAYLYDGAVPDSGTWSAAAFDFSKVCTTTPAEYNKKGKLIKEASTSCGNNNSGGLSHLTFLVGPEKPRVPEDPAPVPLPAAGVLLLAGLGALRTVKRRA